MEQVNRVVLLIIGFSCGLLVGYIFHVFSERKYHRKKRGYGSYKWRKIKENLRLYLVMLLVAVVMGWTLILVNEKASDIFSMTRQSVYREQVHRTIYDRLRDTGIDEKKINKIIEDFRKNGQGR
ncbi:MAG: hypothetical protein GXP53_01345 [Deltaproteobacteria bacterium]|nr:hypothetical protein [Deltaproteobacteria bacterium]